MIFCQNTSIANTNCFNDAQIAEIFKGLKQNEFLKDKLKATEATLQSTDKVIRSQNMLIEKTEEQVKEKDSLMLNNQRLCEVEKAKLNSTMKLLVVSSELQNDLHKKDRKRKFWQGAKYGFGSAIILGVVSVILLK